MRREEWSREKEEEKAKKEMGKDEKKIIKEESAENRKHNTYTTQHNTELMDLTDCFNSSSCRIMDCSLLVSRSSSKSFRVASVTNAPSTADFNCNLKFLDSVLAASRTFFNSSFSLTCVFTKFCTSPHCTDFVASTFVNSVFSSALSCSDFFIIFNSDNKEAFSFFNELVNSRFNSKSF